MHKKTNKLIYYEINHINCDTYTHKTKTNKQNTVWKCCALTFKKNLPSLTLHSFNLKNP